METEGHAQRMRERLEAHGATPSAVKQIGGIVGALAKMPLDMVRGEKAGRNARDGFATEHMEIASYELLKRIAERANDTETVDRVRRDHRAGARNGRHDRRELGQVRRALAARERRDGVMRARSVEPGREELLDVAAAARLFEPRAHRLALHHDERRRQLRSPNLARRSGRFSCATA